MGSRTASPGGGWAAGAPARLGLPAIPLVMALAACSSSGPADVEAGQYRLYATSTSSQALPPDAGLVIGDSALTLTSGAAQKTYVLGEPGARFTVCPPSGKGAPLPLGGSMSFSDLDLEQAAVFGDCGTTSPARVTVVDLTSVVQANPFPFERWAEFCSTADPDCS